MLCIYKHSHQTSAVILLLPIDKQRTACLSPLRNAKHLYWGGGGRRVWQVINVLSFIFFLQAPKVSFSFYISRSAFLLLFCFYGRYYAMQILVNKSLASVVGNSIFSSSVLLHGFFYLTLKLFFHIQRGKNLCVSEVGLSWYRCFQMVKSFVEKFLLLYPICAIQSIFCIWDIICSLALCPFMQVSSPTEQETASPWCLVTIYYPTNLRLKLENSSWAMT